MQAESTAAEIAWAAGLFEGEGTWSNQGHSVGASLAMTDDDVVRRFFAVVGVGRIAPAPKKTYAAHHKPQTIWRACSRADLMALLAMFSPWLSDRRRERGQEVLALQADAMARSRKQRKEFCKNGHRRTPENTMHQTIREGRPNVNCRECANERNRERRERQRLGLTLNEWKAMRASTDASEENDE